MRKLIILRHGKSSWSNSDLNDFDRPLTERGEKNAVAMGEFIAQKNGTPDLVLSSSAKRACDTAALASSTMGYAQEKIETDSELYLANVGEILKSISRVSANINFCVLVGHNPGLTDLVNYFGLKLDNLPTASAVCLEFDSLTWQNISPKNAHFQWLQLAREL